MNRILSLIQWSDYNQGSLPVNLLTPQTLSLISVKSVSSMGLDTRQMNTTYQITRNKLESHRNTSINETIKKERLNCMDIESATIIRK